MNGNERMYFDNELSLLAKSIDRIRSQIHDAESKRWESEMLNMNQKLSRLSERVEQFGKYVSDSMIQLGEKTNRALDDLADLSKQSTAHSHFLAQAASRQDTANISKAPVEAVRALIAAHDQLTAVLESGAEHGDVIRGQRDNLTGTILQLGVRQLVPAVGSSFDPLRARSEFVTIRTEDPNGHDKVAVVEQIGWEMSDGSGLVRPPAVRLFEYKPGSEAPQDLGSAASAAPGPGPVVQSELAEVSSDNGARGGRIDMAGRGPMRAGPDRSPRLSGAGSSLDVDA